MIVTKNECLVSNSIHIHCKRTSRIHHTYSMNTKKSVYTFIPSSPPSPTLLHSVSNSEEWMYFTQANLAAAEHEMQASAVLRKLIERVLQDTSEDLRAQCSRVDLAFNQRCQELTEAKIQLELHLSQVRAQAHTT